MLWHSSQGTAIQSRDNRLSQSIVLWISRRTTPIAADHNHLLVAARLNYYDGIAEAYLSSLSNTPRTTRSHRSPMNGKAFFPLGPTRANNQPLKASDKKDRLRVDVS